VAQPAQTSMIAMHFIALRIRSTISVCDESRSGP